MPKKLRTVSQYRYDFLENGSAQDPEDWSPYLLNITENDPDGNLIRETAFNQYQEPDQIIDYIYDENHNIIEEKVIQDDEITEHTVYERNADGLIMRELHSFLDGSVDTMEYYYDDQIRLVKKILTDSDGELERLEIFEYNGNDLVKETATGTSGNLIAETTYSLDEEGRIEKTEQIRVEQGDSERVVNFFNEQGHRYKTLRYNYKDQLIEINRYTFDEEGNLTEIEEEAQRGTSYIKFYQGGDGRSSTQEEVDSRGQVISTIERQFDEEGRLLEARVYVDGLNYRPNQHYLLKYAYDFHE
ncbi:MAG: hypothetical protein NTU44_12410 [Bacteroidetes bacterium]|nr:hypothetical protein [Bacteroidota bacterium]